MNELPANPLEDIAPPGEEVIVSRPWLFVSPHGRRGPSLFAAVLLTACFHVYVLAILPAAMFCELLAEPEPSAQLDDDEIGNDPDFPADYVSDRIEEVSIPGTVEPDRGVGIVVLLDEPPMSIPPLPGFTLVPEVKFAVEDAGFPSAAPSKIVGMGLPLSLAGVFPQGELDQPPPQGAGPAGGQGGPALRLDHFSGESGSTRERMIREGGGNPKMEKQSAPATAPNVPSNPAVPPVLVLPATGNSPPGRCPQSRRWR